MTAQYDALSEAGYDVTSAGLSDADGIVVSGADGEVTITSHPTEVATAEAEVALDEVAEEHPGRMMYRIRDTRIYRISRAQRLTASEIAYFKNVLRIGERE